MILHTTPDGRIVQTIPQEVIDAGASTAAHVAGGIQDWSISAGGAAELAAYNKLHTRATVPPVSDNWTPKHHVVSNHPADLAKLREWLQGHKTATVAIRIPGATEYEVVSRQAALEGLTP